MSHTVAVSQALTLFAAGRKEEVWQPLISHPFLERHLIMRRFLSQRLSPSRIVLALRIPQDEVRSATATRSERSCDSQEAEHAAPSRLNLWGGRGGGGLKPGYLPSCEAVCLPSTWQALAANEWRHYSIVMR